MAAVGLGRKEMEKYLVVPGVGIACENSGENVTISGDVEALEEIMKAVKGAKPGVLVRKLVVEMAYHSRKYFCAFLYSSLILFFSFFFSFSEGNIACVFVCVCVVCWLYLSG